MEMCASVRECPPSGKSDDGVARALDGIAQRVAMTDPAVEVWRAQLAVSAAESERLAMLLSRDEHARAARFQFARDRNRYIAGRGMLRVLLGSYVNAAPSDIAFMTSAHGKPALADAALGLTFQSGAFRGCRDFRFFTRSHGRRRHRVRGLRGRP